MALLTPADAAQFEQLLRRLGVGDDAARLEALAEIGRFLAGRNLDWRDVGTAIADLLTDHANNGGPIVLGDWEIVCALRDNRVWLTQDERDLAEGVWRILDYGLPITYSQQEHLRSIYRRRVNGRS